MIIIVIIQIFLPMAIGIANKDLLVMKIPSNNDLKPFLAQHELPKIFIICVYSKYLHTS